MAKILLLLTFSFFNYTCKISKNITMKKYEWSSTENAPKKYPMEIVKGNYVLENDEILGIAKGNFLRNGWGTLGPLSVTGDQYKALPKQLSLTWFSFTENKFFSGTADLPIDKINRMFKEEYISASNDKQVSFEYIIIGLAPNGKVAVWAYGSKITKEICVLSFKEDKNIKWEEFISNPDYPMKRYSRAMLEDVFKEKDFVELEKNGVDTLLYVEKYRQHFLWKPKVVGNIKPLNGLYYYYNGESEYNLFNSETEMERPVPKSALLLWRATNNKEFASEIIFDEEEVFSSFQKFSGEHKSGKILLEIEMSNLTHETKAFLRNDTYIYEFKKCKINVYKQ